MSDKKSKAIPLATLLDPDPTPAPVKPGSSVVLHLTNTPNRNVHFLMGEKNADPRLRQAIARELSERTAAYRKGRSSGLQREEEKARRDRVRELGTKYPTLSSLKLYRHPDARSLRDEGMTAKRFANILSEEAPRRSKRTV